MNNMKVLYKSKYTIKLSDTDSAGVLFFASIFKIVHDQYEDWLNSNNLSIASILRNGDYIIPITDCRSSYRKPLHLSEAVDIIVLLKQATVNGFIIEYQILKDDAIACVVETEHVFVNSQSNSRMPIPDEFLKLFD